MDFKQCIKLNSGAKMPVLGYGTWKVSRDSAADLVTEALKVGYRHIDCASAYCNEDKVGEAFKKIFDEEKTMKREEVFITSKLATTHHSHVREACEMTLKHLNLKYLDLYLIHWPFHVKFNGEIDLPKHGYNPPRDDNGRILMEKVSNQQIWTDMEKLVEDGLVKSIGVSNYSPFLIYDILSYCKIPPAVNQVECHPLFQRPSFTGEMKQLGISMTQYSPLGGLTGYEKILKRPEITKLAEKHKKSPAQVCIRWAIERGNVVIPKTANKKRMKENFEVFDFKLSEEDMKEMEKTDEKTGIIAAGVQEFTKCGFFDYC